MGSVAIDEVEVGAPAVDILRGGPLAGSAKRLARHPARPAKSHLSNSWQFDLGAVCGSRTNSSPSLRSSAAKRLKIVRAGAGYGLVDIGGCDARLGVAFEYTPGESLKSSR